MLGLRSLRALDFSDYEGADLIHDLNRPIPDSLRDRFDLIIDAGTTEHVFDVRQALTNYADMLRVGGRIFHSSPANNRLHHGFYQLSPVCTSTTTALTPLRICVRSSSRTTRARTSPNRSTFTNTEPRTSIRRS